MAASNGESIPELMERLRQMLDRARAESSERGRCHGCGRQAVRVNELDECELCQGIQAVVGVETSDVSLEILRASIRAALGRSVHPDDLREMVEEELRGVETSRPTRRELSDRSHELHKAGVL